MSHRSRRLLHSPVAPSAYSNRHRRATLASRVPKLEREFARAVAAGDWSAADDLTAELAHRHHHVSQLRPKSMR